MTSLVKATVACLAGMAAVGALAAQDGAFVGERMQVFRMQAAVSDHAIALAPQATYNFIAAGAGIEGAVVKDAPFSAEGVTETTRTLGDGTKLRQTSSSKIYRDSAGRTRREQTLGTLGRWSAEGEPATTVVINDPVAGASYTLNEKDRTAQRISVKRLDIVEEGIQTEREFTTQVDVDVVQHAGAPAERRMVWIEQGEMTGTVQHVRETDNLVFGPRAVRFSGGETTGEGEDLGERNIGGVIAKGTRSTSTIPVGQMGNDREITVATETWYSPELQTIVLREIKDPLSGDVTYRLSNIQLGDPARWLFEVPPGYTVKNSGSIVHTIRVEEKK